MCSKQIIFFLAGMFSLTAPASFIHADDTEPATVQQQRQEVVDWMEQYVGDELLFKAADLQSLIKKVKALPDDQFEQWYDATKKLRAMLQSEDWLQTRAWLQDFLHVQAIYSDEEMDQFRGEVARLTPSQLVQLLQRFEAKHRSLISMRKTSEENRQAAMRMRNEMANDMPRAIASGSSASRGVQSYFGPASSGPVRSSYAQRKNSYRRNIGIWPGGLGWGRW